MNYFPKKSQPLMRKEIFTKLLRLATQRQFLYKDVLYKQIDHVTLGSPEIKTKILQNCFYVMLVMFFCF